MYGSSIGMPELIVVAVIALYWAVPVGFAIWVIVTLRRLRAGQQAVQTKLDTIERLLDRP